MMLTLKYDKGHVAIVLHFFFFLVITKLHLTFEFYC